MISFSVYSGRMTVVVELSNTSPQHVGDLEQLSKASTVSEPVAITTGPYWQMAYYAVSGFLFWGLLMIQIPFIDGYFGGPGVIFYITFSYGLASNVIRVVLVWYGNRTKKSIAVQMTALINFGGAFTGLTMIAFPVAMTILGRDNGNISFWICIVLTSFMGIFNSLLMNAGFGLMSMAPEKSASFFLLGQTMTGVFTWPIIVGLRAIVNALGGGDETDYIVAVMSLSLSGLITMGTIPLYKLKTRHHPVFSHMLAPYQTPTGSPSNNPRRSRPIKAVFKSIWVPASASWISCLFTFAVFPSQVSLWQPSFTDALYDGPLFRSFLIYVYSIADTIGRMLPRLLHVLLSVTDRTFLTATVVRGIVFVPLMLLSSLKAPELFALDWWRLILIIVFGITNGTNFGLANMLAPRRVDACDKMHVGTILSFTAINGLFVGSLIGIGLKHAFPIHS